jgi:hypothetical protein
MPHQNRDHYLMHREYHGGRGATSREHVTNVSHIGDARPLAAQMSRDHQAKQAFGSSGEKRLPWKSRFPIDGVRVLQRYGSCCLNSRTQIIFRRARTPRVEVVGGLDRVSRGGRDIYELPSAWRRL